MGAERVVVRQNSEFEMQVLAPSPEAPESDHLHPVGEVMQLTPYGMLLAGLGSCTAIVLHTYAQYHDVALHEVELRLKYDRVFAEDCKDCEHVEEYTEQIEQEIVLIGDLTPEERKRLLVISRQCPIHKMLAHGIEVQSRLAEEAPAEKQGG
jgi:putative redox protein